VDFVARYADVVDNLFLSMPIDHLLTTFLPSFTFSPIVTRAFKPPKPSPAGILHIARNWGLDDGGENLIMVGDSIDDVKAGRAAGALTVLLVNAENQAVAESEETDVCINELGELVGILEKGIECSA
jgi:phosphoglycolate phosphatase-like HAD superfamily hydrolase